jgi:hypothetical protein
MAPFTSGAAAALLPRRLNLLSLRLWLRLFAPILAMPAKASKLNSSAALAGLTPCRATFSAP